MADTQLFNILIFRGLLHAMLIFTTFRSVLASIKLLAHSAKASFGNFTRLGRGKVVKINWVRKNAQNAKY